MNVPDSIHAFTIVLIVIGIILLIVHLIYYVLVFLDSREKRDEEKKLIEVKSKEKNKKD